MLATTLLVSSPTYLGVFDRPIAQFYLGNFTLAEAKLHQLQTLLNSGEMNYYLFDSATFDRLYNCSMLPEAEWERRKRPNWIGAIHFSLAIFYQSLYVLFLFVMLKKRFWQHSCYRIMFMLGIFDIWGTVIGGMFCGIFAIRGDIFCTNKTLIYLVGCCQAPVWSGACVTGLILLINRTLDLYDKRVAIALFGGKKTYIWFIFPMASYFYLWFFTKPFLFSSILGAGFLYPYLGIPEVKMDLSEYDNLFCGYHNYFIATIYPLMYLIICVLLWRNGRGGPISVIQKQIIIQSIMISILLALLAVTYMVMQYITVPAFMPVALNFVWQFTHGAPVFTYIFISKSMRNGAGIVIGKWTSKFRFINHNSTVDPLSITARSSAHNVSTYASQRNAVNNAPMATVPMLVQSASSFSYM
ncbi:serpentine type 7TM GPCR chemoreceptor srt domain-containing protein [Ditylenchus destructor]|uniref:Serpentine type 7TM GPCR chemoreceptor srt domain-containing protein n=1 Tax=Ditylenchus destructor TaxID=166010 RepID=A0AAD4MMM3_9BILA|nr:serpentine type 7TM GPCR chemoreceptor srt domain-containing protein [Ditylenchus destructor]